MRKVELGKHSKVNIKWKVLPIDYSHDAEKDIIAAFSRKYGIPSENVGLEPVFINKDGESDDEAFSSDAAQNIQDPAFQKELFKKYIKEREIEGCDIDTIFKIDDEINAKIDYEVYGKHKKYTIKWIRWSNFMSYGPNNYIDLTTLKGLVLLTSEPANQGGKSTFCLDLFRFLLFGKVTSRENDWTLARAFNDHIPSATEVLVEGCISIDGTDYVIKRVLTRPDLKRRTEKSKVTQKISYYKLVNGEYIDLEDDAENENESNGRETNKAIKEAIGTERDFDLMICVNSRNLEGLISLKDAERGRLIARWIGLLPLEEKDVLAREYFNKSVSPKLLLNRYSKEELAGDNEELMETNKTLTETGVKWKKEKDKSEKNLKAYRDAKDSLLSSRLAIDEEIANVDKHTVEERRDGIIEAGKRKAAEKKENEAKYSEVKDTKFDEENYKKLVATDKNLSIEKINLENEVKRLNKEIKDLTESEYCPTCGAKLKGVDFSASIGADKAKIEENEAEIEKISKKLAKLSKSIEDLEENRRNYNEKVKLELIIEKNEVDIENLRSKLKEANRILKELEKNDEAIRHNNEIDAKLNVMTANIKNEESIIKELEANMNDARAEIRANNKIIEDNEKIIETIESEEVLVRNWKVYLEMVGKNGISKMVLRSALPLINGELKRLLSDVCDFDVEIVIDSHNDVAFHHIHDGVTKNLGGCSGFEQTVASLALRSVLSRISTFSKPSFVVFDEILGCVADENYEQTKNLYDKIVKDYAFILQITHLKAIADWHSTQVVVRKENNISTIEVVK